MLTRCLAMKACGALPNERFQELIDDGTINPNMGRKDMDAPKISKKELAPFSRK